MRISTITNWAYGVTLLLTGLSGIAFIASVRAADQERLAVQQHLTLDDFGEELSIASEKRSDEARLFAMRGAGRHLAAFRAEEQDVHSREKIIGRIGALDLAPAERAALKDVTQNLV